MQDSVRKITRVLSGWLLVLFVGYMAGITLFPHTHLINGKNVTHSHPYSQAPDTGNHTHTAAEFTLLAHLSAVVMLAAVAGCLTAFIGPGRVFRRFPSDTHCVGRKPLLASLRGPPSLLSII